MSIKLNSPKIFSGFFGLVIFSLVYRNTLITQTFPVISTLQNYGRIAAIFFLLLWLILVKKHSSNTTIMATILIGWNVLSAVFNRSGLLASVHSYTSIYLIILALEVMKNRQCLIACMRTWMYLVFILMLIDLFTQFKYPSGLYTTEYYSMQNWFMGYKMERVVYTLPMVMIGAFISQLENNRISFSIYVMLLLAFINTYLSGTTIGIVSFALIFVLILLMDFTNRGRFKRNQKFFARILDFRLIMLVYLLLVFATVFMQSQGILNNIGEIFGKNANASGRTIIWLNCIDALSDNWISGVGLLGGEQYVKLTGIRGGTSAHNMILTILMNGGCVGLVLYFAMAFMSIKNINLNFNTSRILLILIYAFFMLGITSSTLVYSTYGFIGFWLAEYLKKTEKNAVRKTRR